MGDQSDSDVRTITVTGETPVVDVSNTLRQTVLSKDLIATLPATRAALKRSLEVERRRLAAGDTLLLYVTDHGTENPRDPIRRPPFHRQPPTHQPPVLCRRPWSAPLICRRNRMPPPS